MRPLLTAPLVALPIVAACTAKNDAPDDDTDAVACAEVALSDAPEVPSALADALAVALDEEARRLRAPGAALGVRLPDGRVWTGVVGLDDVGEGSTLDGDEAFRLGSITKTWIGALVQLDVAAARLSLDDPLEDWFPDAPGAARITVSDLLHHTSGLRDYAEITEFFQTLAAMEDAPDVTVDEVIAWSLDDGLQFEPGEAYSYSNTNYFLLGRILEAVGGTSLEARLRTELLAPAGLERTWMEGYEPAPTCVDLAGGHLGGDVDFEIDAAWRWAAGGLAADIHDLLGWGVALFEGDLLTDAQRTAMVEPLTLPDETTTPYGLGLQLRSGPCGPIVGHTGSTMGFQSDLFRTADGTLYAVLLNDFAVEATDIAEAACTVVTAR